MTPSPAQHAKAKSAAYHKALESAKYRLRDLAGKNAEQEFQKVRRFKESENCGWLAAYEHVTKQLKESK